MTTLTRGSNMKKNFVKNCKVLVIEGFVLYQHAAADQFKALGCEVDIAPDAEDGLKLTATKNYDLIFISMHLPGTECYDIAKEIKKQKHNEHTPMFALTGYDDSDILRRCHSVGIKDMFRKPMSYEKMEEILEQYFINAKKKITSEA